MDAESTILIVTDGKESINSFAQSIKAELAGFDVKICSADDFKGEDILPCELFFLGCETPAPASFAYIEEMLKHINFASRKCAIFSTNEEAIKYLQSILNDCEAAIFEPFVIQNGNLDPQILKNWLNPINNPALKGRGMLVL